MRHPRYNKLSTAPTDKADAGTTTEADSTGVCVAPSAGELAGGSHTCLPAIVSRTASVCDRFASSGTATRRVATKRRRTSSSHDAPKQSLRCTQLSETSNFDIVR